MQCLFVYPPPPDFKDLQCNLKEIWCEALQAYQKPGPSLVWWSRLFSEGSEASLCPKYRVWERSIQRSYCPEEQLLLQFVWPPPGWAQGHWSGSNWTRTGHNGCEPGHWTAQCCSPTWGQLSSPHPAALPGTVQTGDAVAWRRHSLMGGVKDLLTQARVKALFAGAARRVSAVSAGGIGRGEKLWSHHQIFYPSSS